MQITSVKIRKMNGKSRLRAIVSITIDDDFAIHELKIIDGRDGLFVAMPSHKDNNDTYRDIAHPINAQARNLVEETVIKEYKAMLENQNINM